MDLLTVFIILFFSGLLGICYIMGLYGGAPGYPGRKSLFGMKDMTKTETIIFIISLVLAFIGFLGMSS